MTFVVIESDLLELHGIFGCILNAALDIIDRRKIIIYFNTAETRSIVEIRGKHDWYYRLLPGINYCPCNIFHSNVTVNATAYTCEHVLAAKLARLIGNIEKEIVSDDVLSLYLSSIY